MGKTGASFVVTNHTAKQYWFEFVLNSIVSLGSEMNEIVISCK